MLEMAIPGLVVWVVSFFFFKQKTAYEMLRSLVGSEMCIRDSPFVGPQKTDIPSEYLVGLPSSLNSETKISIKSKPVSYTHLTLPTIYSV